ncbi:MULTISPECIES: PIG-L deacetylase family protein [unclassified Marinobacter]|uniref:PIG-L deacetylase family protein n=1 Tax=unclassified Marinobacter TaxID=83889 RepID=UPI000C00E5C6|nr:MULTISPECIES: PIG-L deacetylase family protein [unclassified Marinobacter]PFG09651.1 LmbE family N-acetylglucosaminyl deacetylase [Marinobacter sp. LV10MA510-1]PFG51575.1 LmbE family N-acetylglucosaminyl deacetylase [Marinobacter sp. LV10R520-4]
MPDYSVHTQSAATGHSSPAAEAVLRYQQQQQHQQQHDHNCQHQHAIPVSGMGAILVVSPHPDDETLGCGGLIALCARAQHPVSVLAMTNGEASHPGDQIWQHKLGQIRQQEQLNALKTLGVPNPDVISLALPDGGLDRLRGDKTNAISALIEESMKSRNIKTLFLPAIDDCHNDHQETARLLARIATNYPAKFIFSYQIWPPVTRSAQVSSNEAAYALDIAQVLTLKKQAIEEFRSQLGDIEPAHTEGFRIPQVLLEKKLEAHESYALIQNVFAWSR